MQASEASPHDTPATESRASSRPVSATCSRSPRGGSSWPRARPMAPSTASVIAKRSVSKAKGVAWSSPRRAAMAPLLHSSTNRGVAQNAADTACRASVAAPSCAAQSFSVVMECHLSKAWQTPARRRAATVPSGTRRRENRGAEMRAALRARQPRGGGGGCAPPENGGGGATETNAGWRHTHGNASRGGAALTGRWRSALMTESGS
ncbi:hypothetical protein D3C81_1266100 [compost metagenome]